MRYRGYSDARKARHLGNVGLKGGLYENAAEGYCAEWIAGCARNGSRHAGADAGEGCACGGRCRLQLERFLRRCACWGAWNEGDESINFLPTPAAFGSAPFTASNNRDGFLGGVQVGFNWQAGVWVFGVEADISFADVNGASTLGPTLAFPGLAPIPGSTYTSNWDMNWFGTVRGRLGFTAANTLLLYVTGGLAYADIDYLARTTFAPGGRLTTLVPQAKPRRDGLPVGVSNGASRPTGA